MEWLEQALSEALKGKLEGDALAGAIAAAVTAIKTPMAKNMTPKAVFNETSEALKEANAKLADLNGKLEGLQKADPDKLKADLEKAQQDLATFRAETEKRENDRKKIAAIERGLREAKAADDAVDLLVTQFDLDKIQLDSKGQVVDWSLHLEPVKAARKSAFAEVTVGGTPPANPPGGAAKTTRAQLIEAYNAAEKSKDWPTMIALQRQIKEAKE